LGIYSKKNFVYKLLLHKWKLIEWKFSKLKSLKKIVINYKVLKILNLFTENFCIIKYLKKTKINQKIIFYLLI
jgi:hypothetical protein